ncbi:hypothetical protein FACS1894133_3490 [Clostridia bacterium]|nr:hypothetical protein FACS1894133_3490 [Clostridia bacterium]
MPTLSMFYGIIIRMNNEHSQHHTPHIHAKYQNYESSFDFDGNIISGDFPIKKRKMIEVWIDLHREELEANWELINAGDDFFKIAPLK